MFKSLLPKEYSFYDYFNEHINLCTEATNAFLMLTTDSSKFNETRDYVIWLEKRMDEITHTCTESLINTFITPFERTDIHRLINKMDDIADGINGVLSRMSLYKLYEFKKEIIPLVELIQKSVSELNKAIHGLKHIKDPQIIRNHCENVRKYEKEADDIFRNSLANLFDSSDVIEIIKWKEIYERLEKVMDRTEEVSSILVRIVIEST